MFELFAQLPDEMKEEYKIPEPDDWIDDRHEMINGYAYYPDHDLMIIGTRVVAWENKGNTDTIKVDPYNPEHLAEIVSRGMLRQDEDTIGVVTFLATGKMYCGMSSKKHWPSKRYKESEIFVSFPFDDTEIYYNPKHDHIMVQPEYRLLAECLFNKKRYFPEYIVPYKDVPPSEWGA